MWPKFWQALPESLPMHHIFSEVSMVICWHNFGFPGASSLCGCLLEYQLWYWVFGSLLHCFCRPCSPQMHNDLLF